MSNFVVVNSKRISKLLGVYVTCLGTSHLLIPLHCSWVRLRGPVIQANGRLTFEDDLRSGGLLCFISMNASVRTELADSMVTLGEPGGD